MLVESTVSAAIHASNTSMQHILIGQRGSIAYNCILQVQVKQWVPSADMMISNTLLHC